MSAGSMNFPGIAQGIASRIGGIMSRLSPGSRIAAGITASLVLLFVTVSLFGSDEGSEPVTILRLSEGGSVPEVGRSVEQGASLVAMNGAVISDPDLIEMTPDGPLPRIARNGRQPMEVYARAYDKTDPRPKLALIVTKLGLSSTVTQSAIDQLPPGITLAFSPYGSALQGTVSTARANGHEVLLEVPMEPYDYPENDPGPNTLVVGTGAAGNKARLGWILSRVTGYAGLINVQGSKFLASNSDVYGFLKYATDRGVYFVDDGQAEQSLAPDASLHTGAAFVRADQVIDKVPGVESIQKDLAELETLAIQRGSAVGIAEAYPVSLEQVRSWAAQLEQKGIALVPASALVKVRRLDTASPSKKGAHKGGAAHPPERKPDPGADRAPDDTHMPGPHP